MLSYLIMKELSVLVPLAPGFEEIELIAPVDILRRLGVNVTLAGVEGLSVKGAHGVVIQSDMLLVDVDSSNYDGIVLPGGPAAWALRSAPAVLSLVSEMHRAEKLVAAICAAPIALEAAGVIAGRSVTCYPAPDVRAGVASAKSVSDAPVEVDGHIITGRGPAAALDFGYALGAYLVGEDKTQSLKGEMCYKAAAE